MELFDNKGKLFIPVPEKDVPEYGVKFEYLNLTTWDKYSTQLNQPTKLSAERIFRTLEEKVQRDAVNVRWYYIDLKDGHEIYVGTMNWNHIFEDWLGRRCIYSELHEKFHYYGERGQTFDIMEIFEMEEDGEYSNIELPTSGDILFNDGALFTNIGLGRFRLITKMRWDALWNQ